MWFESWQSVGRVIVSSVVGYAALIMFLRISGKRTLSKLNAFDLVITVALGSAFATVALSKQVPVLDGVIVFGTLIALQYVVAYASVRSRTFSRLVKSQPTLLFYRGELRPDVLRRERLTQSDLEEAVREQGYSSLQDVYAVVLETAGDISVLGSAKSTAVTAMEPR